MLPDTPEVNEILRLLILSAYASYKNSIMAHSPALQDYQKRVNSPRIGDIVFEASSIGLIANRSKEYRPINCIGKLLRVEERRVDFKDCGEVGFYMERYHDIETFDGREFAWHNCEMIAVPNSLEFIKGK